MENSARITLENFYDCFKLLQNEYILRNADLYHEIEYLFSLERYSLLSSVLEELQMWCGKHCVEYNMKNVSVKSPRVGNVDVFYSNQLVCTLTVSDSMPESIVLVHPPVNK